MTHPALAANDKRVADAIATGQRLHLGVTLSYVGGSSDKFWSAVWAGGTIAVNFGRHNTDGEYLLHTRLGGEDGAAKKMWQLLRSKVGKGYAVVDAAVLTLPTTVTTARYLHEQHLIHEWDAVRDARRLNPRRPLDHPELLGTSPRTPTQGAQVLLDITSPHPALETLLASAVADPTERFLPPIVMSRPDVPEEAKFLAALSGTARVVL